MFSLLEKQNISLINKAATPQALSRASRRKILYEKLCLAPRKSSKELIYEVFTFLNLKKPKNFFN